MDERIKFANDVCKLIINENEGVDSFCYTDVQKFYNHFMNNISNFYETVDKIPLFYWYELNTFGHENFGMTERELKKEIEKTLKKCYKKYK